ncbi:unnamed protein product, partial [Closterium sp. NIES-54]
SSRLWSPLHTTSPFPHNDVHQQRGVLPSVSSPGPCPHTENGRSRKQVRAS